MKILNFIKTTALVLLLCMAAAQPAQAGRTGSSAGFKSGFSSHKYSAPSHSVASAPGKSASFGSFGASGNAAPAASSTATKSALSKDLSATAANSAALKTFDARNRPATAPAAPAYAPTYTSPAPTRYVNQPMVAPTPYPQTVIVQRDSGFSSSPWLWFMLGHSMTSHDRVVYERPVYTNSGAVGAPASGANPAPLLAAEPAQESFGTRALRVVLWLAIIGALTAGIIYLLARRAARAAAATTHYSLGKI